MEKSKINTIQDRCKSVKINFNDVGTFERKINSKNLHYSSTEQYSRYFDDRSLSTNIIHGSSIYSNKSNININAPYYPFKLSYCYDMKIAIDNSESSEQISFTDVKLSNLHSKLKAETEEIRQWKKETIINKMENIEKVIKNKNKCNEIYPMVNIQSRKEVNSYMNDVHFSNNFPQPDFMKSICQKRLKKNCSKKHFSVNENISAQIHINYHNENINSTINNKFEKIQTISTEHKTLKEIHERDKIYHSELQKKLIAFTNELEISQENISSLTIKIENLEAILGNRSLVITELELQMAGEISEKDNAIKENVRLKEQQMELKNQMNYFLSFINALQNESGKKSKLIDEFQEEHEKLSNLTVTLKILIDENKEIFKEMNNELHLKNQILLETVEHVKYLEDKFNMREIQCQNLKDKLKSNNYDCKHLQISSRNIHKDLMKHNDELMNNNMKLSKEVDSLNVTNFELQNKIKSQQLEYMIIKKSEEDIRCKLDILQLQFNDCQESRIFLDNKTKFLSDQLEINSVELKQKDEKLNESNELLKNLEVEKNQIQKSFLEMKTAFEKYYNKTVTDRNTLEKLYFQEKIELQDTAKQLTIKCKNQLKLAEKTFFDQNKEIANLEGQISELKQQKAEIIEYLYKLPTSSLKWNNFFQ